MTPTLDELVERAAKKRGGGCRYSGCTQPSRATVSIQLRRFEDGKHSGKYDGSASQQLSLCERHVVEIWQALLTRMEVVTHGD